MSTQTAAQPTTNRGLGADPAGAGLRFGAVVGLAGIVVVHGLDLSGKLEETPYLGYLYLALMAGSAVAAVVLARRDDRRAWAAAAGLAAATLIGFIVNRTVGLPAATDDIGNWSEPLGVASLVVEGAVVLLAGIALGRSARPAAAR